MTYQAFPNQELRNVYQSRIEVPTLVRALAIPPGTRILEVGCGRGIALPVLAHLCSPARLVGVDIDESLVTIARERMTRFGTDAEVHTGDVRRLPFADGAFDIVIDFGTCYHIDYPERALNEIARVLDDGGTFIHETRVAQLFAHPLRASGRALPWGAEPRLMASKDAILWAARRRTARPSPVHPHVTREILAYA
jgi:ubiquinone/menaquinone biosynthesis C-methylase UbiE